MSRKITLDNTYKQNIRDCLLCLLENIAHIRYPTYCLNSEYIVSIKKTLKNKRQFFLHENHLIPCDKLNYRNKGSGNIFF